MDRVMVVVRAGGDGASNALFIALNLYKFAMDTAILDTHYGVVRHLYYNVFRRRNNQINDLQQQVLFLRCINKYLLCRNGQYAHLYNLYSALNEAKIRDYYELNRLRINRDRYEWLNYTSLVNAPRTIPATIDGPYSVDSLCLRRYAYFWGDEYRLTSPILATPFFCLAGIDHLYYEMIRWKSQCETISGLEMTVRGKHIFHDIFYIVEFRLQQMHVRYLVWLDDVDVQTELYVAGNCEDEECGDDASGRMPVNLLRRLYIGCDNSLLITQLSLADETNVMLRLLNMLINNLSANFVVSLDGRPPKNTKSAILNVTNNAEACLSRTDKPLVFEDISRFGFSADRSDQIYEIEHMSQLNLGHIRTPNFLVFQHEIRVARQPTIVEMNRKLQEFLYFLSMGMLDTSIYVRMYMNYSGGEHNRYVDQKGAVGGSVDKSMVCNDDKPNSAKKQLNIIYMQRYNKFEISRQSVDFNATFYDKTYVFSARNLICTVKSIKYLLRDVIPSHPLLPGTVMLIDESGRTLGGGGGGSVWSRLTQNIVYLRRLKTFCFLINFSLQELHTQTDDADIKGVHIVSDTMMRDELNKVFVDLGGINRFDIQTIVLYNDVELKRVRLLEDLNLQLYYFVHRVDSTATAIEDFRKFFQRFMLASETKSRLNDDRLYAVFMHLLNLYSHVLL